MNMSKNQYVDSVMRVLGNSSIELYTYEYDVFQSELESEYDKVLESENYRVLDKTYLSQRMLMHLQAGLEDYEVFVRSLAIGPQVSSFHYDPEQPPHGRYVIDHHFLNEDKGREAQIITKQSMLFSVGISIPANVFSKTESSLLSILQTLVRTLLLQVCTIIFRGPSKHSWPGAFIVS